MGICSSSNLSEEEKKKIRQESRRDREIDNEAHLSHEQDQAINKLLLLGAGESGKSTLFKQMITIYGKGYPEEERKTYVPIIYNNIISSMKILCQQLEHYGKIDPANIQSKMIVDELKGDEDINPLLGYHLKALWVDPGIQETFNNRSAYQLNDSTEYFLNRIDVIAKEGYIPDEQDVLRSRVRTTGIVENEFIIDGNQFKMFDVGGQRNERKKWIHCFENVTAVLFVAAISEYDQVLYEDENTNRIVEALSLFDDICNSRWFRDTSMILFLNKRDLFERKIQRVPLSVAFPDYNGPDEYQPAVEYMQMQFESRNRNADKQIYTHVTCATDTGNVAAVFNAVKDIIIRRSLGEAGLV